jgi:transposase InsO family protein
MSAERSADQGTVPVARACELVSISRSWYYDRQRRKRRNDTALQDEIEKILAEFDGYGYRRVTRELVRRGEVANHKRVLRIMREQSWLCRLQRRGAPTTVSDHGLPTFPESDQGQGNWGPQRGVGGRVGSHCGSVLCCLARSDRVQPRHAARPPTPPAALPAPPAEQACWSAPPPQRDLPKETAPNTGASARLVISCARAWTYPLWPQRACGLLTAQDTPCPPL